MRITKYAQSTAQIDHGIDRILVDPGIYNFTEGRTTRELLPPPTVLIITHAHADHYDLDTVKILAARCRMIILTTQGIHDELNLHNIDSRVFGETEEFETKSGIAIQGTKIDHVVNGERVDGFGVVITADSKSIYHTSDTLYLERKPTHPTLLLVPINNRGVCMSIDEAVQFAQEVKPMWVVPIHYDSPKDIGRVDPQEFVSKIRTKAPEIKVRTLGFGEQMSI